MVEESRAISGFKRAREQVRARDTAIKQAREIARTSGSGTTSVGVRTLFDEEGKVTGFQATKTVSLPGGSAEVVEKSISEAERIRQEQQTAQKGVASAVQVVTPSRIGDVSDISALENLRRVDVASASEPPRTQSTEQRFLFPRGTGERNQELQTPIPAKDLASIAEEQEQQAIRAEKEEQFGTFLPQIFTPERAEQIETSVETKLSELKSSFFGTQPIVNIGELPGGRFVTAAVFGAGATVLTKRLPPQVTASTTFQTLEGALGQAFVASKTQEFTLAPTTLGKVKVVGTAAAEIAAFSVGGGLTGLTERTIKFDTIKVDVKETTPNLERISVELKPTKETSFFIGKAPKAPTSPLTITRVISSKQLTNLGKTPEFKVVGLEAGTRSIVLGAKTPEGRIRFGGIDPIKKIKLADLKSEIAAPATSLKFKTLRNVLELSPAIQKRIDSVLNIARAGKGEKGLKVKEALFELKTLKNKKKSTKILEQELGDLAVVFGSTTTQQLPRRFQLKPGDIDVIVPSLSVEQLTPRIEHIAKRLRLEAGEKVQVSKENPLIIEQVGTREKVLETKSGINQETLGEAFAEPGFAGITFPDIRSGKISKTVKFGEFRAIKPGEQLTRKAAASTFFRPADTGSLTPKAFQLEGVLPRGRRTKDIAGFLASAKGIQEIKETKLFRSTRKGKKIGKNIETFFESFTPEQQAEINKQFSEGTFGGTTFPLKRSATISGTIETISPSFRFKGTSFSIKQTPSTTTTSSSRTNKILKEFTSPSPSRIRRTTSQFSPLRSPSRSKISSSISKFTSPSPSKSPSPSPSKSPSPSSISKFTSPSPSRIPSPSPSLFKSPSPSPSPTGGDSDITVPGGGSSTGRRGFRFDFPQFKPSKPPKPKPSKKLSRELRFQPSIVAIETKVKGKKSKLEKEILTGLEVRPIPL